MDTKALAFITPLQPHENFFNVPAEVRFLTGERKGKKVTAQTTTDIFRYYFFGTTLETVEFDKAGNIINIRDVRNDEFHEFGLNLLRAYSFNLDTTEMLCSSGFIYILNQSRFWRDYPWVCENIMSRMQTAHNIVMYVYTMDDTLLTVNVEFDLKPTDKRYKKAVHRGFITTDRERLKLMAPLRAEVSDYHDYSNGDPNEILRQEDIDKLIKEMTEGERGTSSSI